MSDRAEDTKKIAKEVVDEIFLRMGMDTSSNEDILQVQKDFAYLRELRVGKEEFIKKGKMTLIASFVTGLLAVLINGLLNWNK